MKSLLIIILCGTSLAVFADQPVNTLLAEMSSQDREKAINVVNDEFHNYQSYFNVATRWRVVTVDVPTLIGTASSNANTVPADGTKSKRSTEPTWAKSAEPASTVLNLFDDVTVSVAKFRQTNKGRERSYRETLDGDKYPIDVRSYDIEIPDMEAVDSSSDLSVSGGRVKMERLILQNGLMYSVFPVGKSKRQDISALREPRKIPHVVFEFNPRLPGTMEVLTPAQEL